MKNILCISVLGVSAALLSGCGAEDGGPVGIVSGKLAACPDKPNCVNSEHSEDAAHFINAMDFSRLDALKVRGKLKDAIKEIGGAITQDNGDYIAATFTSSVFKFIDDLETGIDLVQGKIHVRSASRTGHSDLGVNKKRIDQLKDAFK